MSAPLPSTASATHGGQGFVVDTVDFGEVEGDVGLNGEVTGLLSWGIASCLRACPSRVRAVLGFRIKLHKTNGWKWPFPNLTGQ